VQSSRLETLQRMLEARPTDTRARFGLALEYERLEHWDEVVHHLREYLRASDDEGNAYGRLARGLIRLGRPGEAAEAYRDGIEAARRHGHPTLALELEEELESLEL
jgi:tetratricopeptide (TPR) repeat protein